MPPTSDNVNINIKALVQGLADVRALVSEIQKLPGAGAGITGLNKDIAAIQNQLRGAATEIRSLGNDAYGALAKVNGISGNAAKGIGQISGQTTVATRNLAELSQGAAAVGRAFRDAVDGNILGALQSIGVALRTSLNFSVLTAEGVPAFQRIGAEVINTDRLMTRFSSTLGTAAKNIQGTLNKDLLANFGINATQALANPELALQKFIAGLALVPDANDRAAASANIFGASTAKLLPTIEALVAVEQAATVASAEYAAAQTAVTAAQARVAAASTAVASQQAIVNGLEQAGVATAAELAAARTLLATAHVESVAAKTAETLAAERLALAETQLAATTTAVAAAEVAATGATITFGAALTVVAVGIGAILAVAGGIILAGLAIGKSFSDAGSELNDMSEKTGLTVSDLSALKLAADQSGSSIDNVSGSFTKYLKNINEAANGNKAASATFKELGIDAKAANTDSTLALQQLFEALNKIPQGAQQVNAAMKLAGKSGGDLIPIVNQVKGNFAEFKKEAEELGIVLSADAAKAADEFGDQLTLLGTVVGGLRNQIGAQLLPTLIELATSLENFIRDNRQGIADLAYVIAVSFKVALGVFYAFGGIVAFLTNLVYALVLAFGGLITIIGSGINTMIAAAKAMSQVIAGNIAGAMATMEANARAAKFAAEDLLNTWEQMKAVVSQPVFTGLFKLFNDDSSLPKAPALPKPINTFRGGGGGGKSRGGGGQSDAKALADAQIALEKARLDAMTDLLRDSIKTEQDILQEKFSQNLIDYAAYYRDLAALQIQDNEAQIARQRKLIEIEERQLAGTKKGSERVKGEAELVKLNADLEKLLRNNENITRRTTVEVQKQARAYADMMADIKEQLAEFEGDKGETAAAKIDREFRDKLAKAQNRAAETGDDADVKRIERLKEILKAQSQAKILEDDVNNLMRERDLLEDSLNQKVQQGSITREQANQQLAEFERAQSSQIRDLLAGMDAYASKVADPDLQAAVERIKQGLAEWDISQTTRDVDLLKDRVGAARTELDITLQNINTAQINGAYNEQQANDARAAAIQTYFSEAIKLLAVLEQIAIATKNADLQAYVDKARADLGELKADSDDMAISINKGFINAFTDLFTSISDGTKSAKQAFADFGRSVLAMLTQLAIKILITKLAMAALGGATGGSGGIGGFLSGLLGGDGAVGGKATGGLIGGKGSGTSDSNIWRLSRGEYVVNAAATAQNLDLLEDINSGLNPKRNTSIGSNVIPASNMASAMASNLKVVNVLPNDLLDNYVTSGDGSTALLNFIDQNTNAINARLKQGS